MTIRIQAISFDAHDPAAQGRWWSEALGWRITDEDDNEVVLEPPAGSAEVARFESLGARRTDVGQSDDVTWVVMADPEGNEFCILRALTAEELADT